MAKAPKGKGKAKKEEQAAGKIIMITDLSAKYGVPGVTIRQLIRGLGLRAPKVENQVGFGPKSKYQWNEGSEELAKIEAVIKEHAERMKDQPAEKAPAAKGKSKKKSDPEPEPAEDEDDEPEDEDDEEDEE